MWNVYLYAALLLICGTYALAFGGAPERLAAGAMIASSLLSPLIVPEGKTFREAEWGLFLVDLTVEAIMLWLMIKADRFWPIPMVGLQTVTVLVSLSMAAVPGVVPMIYYWSEQASSFLILLIIAAATTRHRMRLRRNGSDVPWSTSSAW